jgi:hypothetical protein
VAAILKHLALPEHPLIQAQEMHIPLLQHYYQPETKWKGMWRMAVTSTTFQPLIGEPLRQVKRLTTSDLPALKNLYAQHLESTFSTSLFTQGVYVGVWKGKHLIAAGGTHALAPLSHIAVLGNILQHQKRVGRDMQRRLPLHW